jgi:hypothetical protein
MWYFSWILGLPLAAAFAMTEDQKLRQQLLDDPDSQQ